MMRLRRPSWFAVALTVFGVLAFVRLGVWQLDRAVQKEQLLQRFADASHTPLVDFSAVPSTLPEQRDPHVRVHVRYLADHVYILDDQIHSDRQGVQVFMPALVLAKCGDSAPCHPQSSKVLLVDMGFLPRQNGMRKMPDLPPLKHPQAMLTGLYAAPPAPGLRLGGNALRKQGTWPKLTTYIDLNQIGADLGRPIYPRVLLLDHDPSLPYIRAWKPQTMPPARHRAYAFQWFSFAAAALAIFVILHRRGKDDVTLEEKDDDEHDRA
ncbi:MAG: SURF1 family protein [Xanthomonadales bacterium]|nr:SURF1 family protein [Xanthomonadales bacterium]